ncbi:aspartate dehydrogenase [Tropicimonas sp. TH_r6]|uniref:aspartate dehydrogenase n=1 Tax=Tropicimonas sp. TH_r6 TaxID=3082085 RepID=UPI002952E6AD|nr:aspartate dehydrogenase [Tropicimonas sp. TH_r6]MDV7145230.1 aspartate dehydrogenase [Tropicimonas sp. TH_r6]
MKVGIAGMGAIGLNVAGALDRDEIPGCTLAGFAARSQARADAFNATLARPVAHLGFEDLADRCDLVIECLPPQLFEAIARPVLERGKSLVVLSASQLLGRDDLIALAEAHGGRILVPSGAMLGLDALKAAAVGEITSVTIETRKPVAGLLGAPYLAEAGIDLTGLDAPRCILSGSVTEVARAFPANVNVAAAVSLAGLGPDLTRLEIWADPGLERNQHSVHVISDSSDFTMTIQGRPSAQNPATGRITPQSVIALLRQRSASLRVGT